MNANRGMSASNHSNNARQSNFRRFAKYFVGFAIFLGVGFYIIRGLPFGLPTRAVIALTFVAITELAALVIFARGMRRRGISLRDLGLGKPAPYWTIALAVFGALIYAAITVASPSLNIRSHWLDFNTIKLFGVTVGIIAAFVEEIIFRGFVINNLVRSGSSITKQIILSGLIFGAAHLMYGPGALFATALGIFLGWLYIRAGRSLTPVIICHALINIIIEPWLIMSALK